MSTGTALVLRAGKKIGAHSIANPMDPNDIADSARTLNSMLHQWLSDGIDIGFTPIDLPGEEVNEPPDTTNAIINNLAIQLAPEFDTPVSPQLQANADGNFFKIKELYEVITIPEKVVSSTLPVGAGNDRGIGLNTFFREGQTVKN